MAGGEIMVVKRARLALTLACLLAASQALAAVTTLNTQQVREQSLLPLWFELQAHTDIQPPYAWIRHRDTQTRQDTQKRQLLAGLQHLADQHPALNQAMSQWSARLLAVSDWREPGHWGASDLMTSDRKGVPATHLSAIGACDPPDWIEVWSTAGVTRLPWQPAMRLGPLFARKGTLHDIKADWATLVLPWGETQKRGVAAWNLDDTQLLPGTRLLLTPIASQRAAKELTQQLADLLAHLLPGDTCHQLLIEPDKDTHAPNT
jgi:hypothetical protein